MSRPTHPRARVGVVVVAAGMGLRLGAGAPKALVEVQGRPLVAHAVARLRGAGLPPAVVVHPAGFAEDFHAAGDAPVEAFVVGGRERRDSVRAGLERLADDLDVVVVHDAARAFAPVATIRAVVAAVTGPGGVVAAAPGLPVADTLKRVVDGAVVATVDRSELRAAQTPQAFTREVLAAALAGSGADTDELGPVERLVAAGRVEGRVVLVEGSEWARKVTYPADLEVLSALSARQEAT
jgi:2-C-methyl-D-erythritol 4-phosphate cytidylyltransferase